MTAKTKFNGMYCVCMFASKFDILCMCLCPQPYIPILPNQANCYIAVSLVKASPWLLFGIYSGMCVLYRLYLSAAQLLYWPWVMSAVYQVTCWDEVPITLLGPTNCAKWNDYWRPYGCNLIVRITLNGW